MHSAEDVAKKIKLKSRIEAKEHYTRLENNLNDTCIRLDHESTLALHRSIQAKKLWGPPFGYGIKLGNPFVTHEVENNFDFYLDEVTSFLEKNQNEEVFLFPYEWKLVGCIILKIETLIEDINQNLLFFEDEMRIYLPNFSNGLLLYGERYGTGDSLNLLSISVTGREWEHLSLIK